MHGTNERLAAAPSAPRPARRWTARRIIATGAIVATIGFLISTIGPWSTLVIGLVVWLFVKLGASRRDDIAGAARSRGAHLEAGAAAMWAYSATDCGAGLTGGFGGDCGSSAGL